ncbi:hypothetical protein [Pedobacter ghigonis]|uniref:hypothetical protein n=1 Tax=Pedobacter ghigonis TaxID=2730403 RepID=UPI00158E5422|nr:hypothetical protein [Pedobacter ghigonis]
MNNRFCLIAVFFCIACGACFAQNKQQKDEWLMSYKRQVFISCLKSQDTSVSKNDISESVNFDLIGNTASAKQADSLGKEFYKLIQPSKILDHNKNKALVNECLAYYESKQLDSIAKSAYKKYLEAKKNLN